MFGRLVVVFFGLREILGISVVLFEYFLIPLLLILIHEQTRSQEGAEGVL
ncbi:MAG: hypothetical protein ACE5GD_07530 [Candidatus Geothermarchaeales archaeon]